MELRNDIWLISDEIDSDDNHLGYWGNIKMGNKITSIIGELSSLDLHWGGYTQINLKML